MHNSLERFSFQSACTSPVSARSEVHWFLQPRKKEAEGKPHESLQLQHGSLQLLMAACSSSMAACSSSWRPTTPHREQTGSADLRSLLTETRPESMAWSCIRGGSGAVRKRLCPRGWWARNRMPRAVCTAPRCWSSRGVWTLLSVIWSDFGVALCRDGSWTHRSL